ncbi:2-dehydro-3-deoxygalactonokinase [Halobacillus sp. Marseille-Q1614]|uniref:2-dehydro-3-deoxygalactonokinase n=1 Tax=Halobacillus sp. Marseille-Q1614 TaxID=2709134 RepID=UPI00156F33E1|nr:2-dehydro-3-deoxygalactonokinase [Halobacillus sp. Marseille-Q1614]
MIILIDSGTTNSRIRLVEEKQVNVIDVIKLEAGVRNSAIEGSNEKLKNEVSKGLKELLDKHSLSPEDIQYIVAAGMITSNLGLYEVPHIEAPARLEGFLGSVEQVNAEEFFQIPCLYVPGMKNKVSGLLKEDLTVINQFDIMRGEEVETFGLLQQVNPIGKGLMLLPGSHTKFVLVDENGELLSCCSTLGGEMLKAVRDQTIISDSLSSKLVDKVLPEYLIKGYEAAIQEGMTRSLFHIRLLQLFSELSENERANYYAGIILSSDMEALDEMLEKEEVEWIIVGGSNPLRSVFLKLLSYLNLKAEIIEASEEQVEMASVYGAAKIGKAYFSN